MGTVDEMTKRQCYARPAATRVAWATLALAALLGVAGCASLRLEAPRLAVARVEVDRLTPTDARFSVIVAVTNPNDRPIAVQTIDASLRIEDVVIGTARLADPVQLPARGDATARLSARGDLASSLRAAAEVASKAAREGDAFRGIRYSVDGTAVIDGGNTYPFSRSGEIAWNPRTRGPL